MINMIIEFWDDEGFLVGIFDGIVWVKGSRWKEFKNGFFRIRVEYDKF